jgi:hypothetical protein
MRTLRIIILGISVITIILVLIFIVDYQKLFVRANLISLMLILVSALNIISAVLSLRKS